MASSLNDLKGMIKEFEETASLTVRSDRGRKHGSEDVITCITAVTVDGSQGIMVGTHNADSVEYIEYGSGNYRKRMHERQSFGMRTNFSLAK
ncbi:hypothetical protein TNCV_461151 [Trichonephila clavipes]|nr:hypothetical protein TNCV_461151 [Trichonephila clavipes]